MNDLSRPGSTAPRVKMFTAEPRYWSLIGHALLLACIYPNDPCDDHADEEGFIRCQPCVTRDAAEAVAK